MLTFMLPHIHFLSSSARNIALAVFVLLSWLALLFMFIFHYDLNFISYVFTFITSNLSPLRLPLPSSSLLLAFFSWIALLFMFIMIRLSPQSPLFCFHIHYIKSILPLLSSSLFLTLCSPRLVNCLHFSMG